MRNTRRDVPILRTMAPGSFATSLLYSCGFDDVPSGFLITNASARGDSGIENAESGAPVINFSISLLSLVNVVGDILGDMRDAIFLYALIVDILFEVLFVLYGR